MVQNKSVIYKSHPEGLPKPGENLAVEDRPLDLDKVTLESGGLVLENLYASIDPYQRGRMRKPEIKSYSAPFQIGKPIDNFTVSRVIKSENPGYKSGDLTHGIGIPTQEYTVLDGSTVKESIRKIDNKFNLDPKLFIGPLGMPGMTAYSSYYDIAEPKKGETIFVSAASGAVGQIVGQLAKHDGLRVIGSVGDDQKLDFILKELGFDGGFNYKKEKPADALARLAPDGIDIYYENVGGEHLEAAIDAFKNHGRAVLCGMVSQYNLPPKDLYPIRNLALCVGKRLKLQGFLVFDMWEKYFDQFLKNMQQWIHDGSFKVTISETKGIDNGPDALVGMLKGANFGKTVLTIKSHSD